MNIKMPTQRIHLKPYQTLQRPLFKNKYPISRFPLTLQKRPKSAFSKSLGMVHGQHLSVDGVDGDVVDGVVRKFPDMAGMGCVEHVLLVEQTADAAGCFFDFLGRIGGEFGGEGVKTDGNSVDEDKT